MKHLRLILVAVMLGLIVPPLAAAAAQKIPALAVIPTALPHDDYMLYDRSRQRLEDDYAKFKQASDLFNAKTAAAQSDKEFNTLLAERQRVVDARNGFNHSINGRIEQLSAAAGFRAFVFPQISVSGDFRLITADGRILSGESLAGAVVDNRTRAVTGQDSKAVLILPDNTSFTIGTNSDMVLDDFVYDPSTTTSKISVRLAKGSFRWITGKVARRDPTSFQVTTPVIAVGIRGTDFSCVVNPDESGEIRLYSGELELKNLKSGIVSILMAGQRVTFANGKSNPPVPFTPDTGKSLPPLALDSLVK